MMRQALGEDYISPEEFCRNAEEQRKERRLRDAQNLLTKDNENLEANKRVEETRQERNLDDIPIDIKTGPENSKDFNDFTWAHALNNSFSCDHGWRHSRKGKGKYKRRRRNTQHLFFHPRRIYGDKDK